MEKLKKQRSVVRTIFSRTVGSLNTELDQENPNVQDIQARFAVIKDKTCELEELNQKIMEVMLDIGTGEEERLREIETSDEYKLKYQRIKQGVNRKSEQGQLESSSSNDRQVANALKENIRTYKLPKIELKKFSGDLKEWLQFWSLFKNIHEDANMAKEDKFQYLIQAMVTDSRASELINSFPPTTENYDKAITVYVREMLKLILHKAVKIGSKMSLSSIYDKLETHMRALESLGVTTDMCASILYPLVESSLPEELLRVWQRNPKATACTTSKQRLDELMLFLQAEVLSEERIAMAVYGFGLNDESSASQDKTKRKAKSDHKEIPTAAGLLSTKEEKLHVCIFCEQGHESALCIKAKKMTREDRQKIVKEQGACFCCLKKGHSFKTCRYKGKCSWCGRKHVLLMCRNLSVEYTSERKQPVEAAKVEEIPNLTNVSYDGEISLQTLRVKLINKGKERQIRAIVDTGSHRSYVLDRFAAELNFEVIGQQQIVHKLFGGSKSEPQDHKQYQICLKRLDDSYTCQLVALNQKVICHDIPPISKGSWLQELKREKITISDVDSNDEPIAVLIGADVAGKLITGRRHELKCGPVAIETLLGWTLIGKTNVQRNSRGDTVLATISMFNQEANVSELWKLDVLGITDLDAKKTEDVHQAEVKERFRQTIQINTEGRYEVLLSWKENHPPLSGNEEEAKCRLKSTTKKLQDQNFYDAYQEVFDQWICEGIIERVDDRKVQKNGYYLPHRPVIKEDSTTKVRPVFDASAAKKGLPSLNQCLEVGPNLIEQIPTLLLRFRRHRIGAIADIRKAFLQISISPEDRNVLRFIWWKKDCASEMEIYQHCRVVFGVKSSPFLLGGIIEYHLEKMLQQLVTEKEKRILQLLKKSFYVDNCVTSVDSITELRLFKNLATRVMAKGKFDLRGWEYTGQMDNDTTTSVLGLRWNKKEDVLQLTSSLMEPSTSFKFTKRGILSAAQRIFDPIGITCPVILKPKLMLQDLWEQKIDWDTELPLDVRADFNDWLQELHWIKRLYIPR